MKKQINKVRARQKSSFYTPPSMPSDYKDITPGTPEWLRYWKEHPEKQDEMIEWAKKC